MLLACRLWLSAARSFSPPKNLARSFTRCLSSPTNGDRRLFGCTAASYPKILTHAGNRWNQPLRCWRKQSGSLNAWEWLCLSRLTTVSPLLQWLRNCWQRYNQSGSAPFGIVFIRIGWEKLRRKSTRTSVLGPTIYTLRMAGVQPHTKAVGNWFHPVREKYLFKK